MSHNPQPSMMLKVIAGALCLASTASATSMPACLPTASQHGEETFALNRWFSKMNHGTYVEIGALDGEEKSNTLTFECMGWDGLLIEGSPSNFKRLASGFRSGKAHTRLVHSAVCAPPTKFVEFTDDTRGGAVQTAVDTASSEFMRQWHPEGVSTPTVSVPCLPMASLLGEHLQHINFFSLDVEGAELIVLETIDFEAVQIDVFVIELDDHDPKKNNLVRALLLTKGYNECKHSTGQAYDALKLPRWRFTQNGWFVHERMNYDMDACVSTPADWVGPFSNVSERIHYGVVVHRVKILFFMVVLAVIGRHYYK